MELLNSSWNTDTLCNFCSHRSCMLNIAGSMGWFKTMAYAPCSWFFTFHSLSFCSWSLLPGFFYYCYLYYYNSVIETAFSGPYLILKIFCCQLLWNQSGMPGPQGGSWAAREFKCEGDESTLLLCIPLSVVLWLTSTSDERHCNSKNN